MGHILECYEIVKTDFVRGENCYLYDRRGRRYVDLESGCWAAVLGHNHPRIRTVMLAQIEQLVHIGKRYPNDAAEAAAADVLAVTGIGEGKCVFLSSGSEAVEFAVQAARRVGGKPLCLTFTNSYLSSYGSAGGKKSSEWHLLDWSACSEADGWAALADIPFDQIGAFVFEPGGSGIGFIQFPPQPLVAELARRVRQAGGLIVVNEITTGMGRTGKWFGFQHYGLEPDLIALGKGLGNGYPVSAIAIRMETALRLERGGFHYVQSHQNDPLGCAIAREVIAVMRTEDWVERGNAAGAFFLDGLTRLQEKYPLAKEARGRGALVGLELHPDERMPAARLYRRLFEQGYLATYYAAGNILRFDPALTVPREEIQGCLDALDGILQTAD
jgi:acetylornithine/N-succinyldiaminopimelate aminotransferase